MRTGCIDTAFNWVCLQGSGAQLQQSCRRAVLVSNQNLLCGDFPPQAITRGKQGMTDPPVAVLFVFLIKLGFPQRHYHSEILFFLSISLTPSPVNCSP